MTKKKSQTLDGHYSPWQILDAANGYYELSTLFTYSLPKTITEVENSSLRMERAVASATNRLLALELYFKATLIGADVAVPKEHDLKILFDALPKHLRQTVKEHYDDRSQVGTAPDVCWELGIHFRLGSDAFEDAARNQHNATAPTDTSLSALLVRNRHGFVSSRYLFQNARHDKISSYNYEYKRLAILCGILCEGLENSLPSKQSGYARNFIF